MCGYFCRAEGIIWICKGATVSYFRRSQKARIRQRNDLGDAPLPFSHDGRLASRAARLVIVRTRTCAIILGILTNRV